MQLPAEEPEVVSWREMPLGQLVDLLLEAAAAPEGRPAVVALDGRSASGKSTLAATLQAAVLRSAVVHTDDIAWNHSFFDWADLLLTGVLQPVHRGEAVSYRPPAWDDHDRPGTVEVPRGLELLLIEGVGSGRRELTPLVDAVVWVQADLAEAERRGLVRDLAESNHGTPEQAVAFWHEWMAEERQFLADQRTWERACVIVAGTPPEPCGDGHVMAASPPPPSR